MVREPSQELIAATAPFQCVRVTDMSRVDLDTFAFDYDLTLSVLLLSLDGFDLVTTFTSVATCLNNVGPGLEMVGPMGSFPFKGARA